MHISPLKEPIIETATSFVAEACLFVKRLKKVQESGKFTKLAVFIFRQIPQEIKKMASATVKLVQEVTQTGYPQAV